MAKIFGGSASRLEVYALFAAAVVLIGGGVAGAVVVTSSDSKPAEVASTTTALNSDASSEPLSATADSLDTSTVDVPPPVTAASQPTTQSGLQAEQENSPLSPTTLPLCADYYTGCGSPPVTATSTTSSTVFFCAPPRQVTSNFIGDMGDVIQHVRSEWWPAGCGEMQWNTYLCLDSNLPWGNSKFLGFVNHGTGWKQVIAINYTYNQLTMQSACDFRW
jgi:hypothetical protein